MIDKINSFLGFIKSKMFEIALLFSFIVFIFFFFFRGKTEYNNYTKSFFSIFSSSSSKTIKQKSKAEAACRAVIEKMYGRPFPTVRPSFLRNPLTGRNLELDMYNDELKLAVEYNGAQHYKFNTKYHRTDRDLEYQKQKDELKKRMCEENGIILITIPYTVKESKFESYIKRELEK